MKKTNINEKPAIRSEVEAWAEGPQVRQQESSEDKRASKANSALCCPLVDWDKNVSAQHYFHKFKMNLKHQDIGEKKKRSPVPIQVLSGKLNGYKLFDYCDYYPKENGY